jgi:ABC-type transporter Mla maintaining outer membrane lipid asymmetry ATPase subunit MlaF
MTQPLVAMRGVVKDHGGAVPLRVDHLMLSADTTLVIGGLDAAAAETFVHLVSGAAVPDEGTVHVAGTDTRSIATDREWLQSLDRFGVVTDRAVLIGHLSVAANIALPISLSVEPMSAVLMAQVEALADRVELSRSALGGAVAGIDAPSRARLHLARALACTPSLVLLEHPTAAFSSVDERAAFGRSLQHAVADWNVGWVALSDDEDFVRATGVKAQVLDPRSGRLRPQARWWPWRLR